MCSEGRAGSTIPSTTAHWSLQKLGLPLEGVPYFTFYFLHPPLVTCHAIPIKKMFKYVYEGFRELVLAPSGSQDVRSRNPSFRHKQIAL